MSAEDLLAKFRRNHAIMFHRTVETVDVVLKTRSHRVEVFESAGRFGYSVFEYRDLEQEKSTVLHLDRFTKAEYTNANAALTAALQSLGYRCQ